MVNVPGWFYLMYPLVRFVNVVYHLIIYMMNRRLFHYILDQRLLIYVFYFMGNDMVMNNDWSRFLIIIRIITTFITTFISTFIIVMIILRIVIMLVFNWCLNISFVVYFWML